MKKSGEARARAVIQSIRPQARKHGLKGGIVTAYLQEFLPRKYAQCSRDEMKEARNYKWCREEAEYYRPPFAPDLSEIYVRDREIIIYEIEASSPVTKRRIDQIEYWLAMEMDAWASWDLLLVTTNRYGLGWDVLIDTKANGKTYALDLFKRRPEDSHSWYPERTSVAAIEEEFRWINWQMPSMDSFSSARYRILHAYHRRQLRAIEARYEKRAIRRDQA